MINNNWVFGDNAGLDFSTAPAPPTPTSGFAMSTVEGCASISDVNGDLLFYTDGSKIWDKNHTVQVTGLLGNVSSTQSAIIVPDPGNNKQYYVFTADGASGSNNHFNGGLFNIVSWAWSPLSTLMTLPSTEGFSPVEKVTAIQHENCKDFWVLTVLQKAPIEASQGKGIVRAFRVDATGVYFSSDTSLNENIMDFGYMKASPDGRNLAIANSLGNKIFVYPFNRSTGLVNSNGKLSITALLEFHYGIEFSPNSKLLYYGALNSGEIFQVDLAGSLTSVPVGDVGIQVGALQLGRDNRIYVAKLSKNSLGAILSPNTVGIGCNVQSSYLTLPSGSTCYAGLPNLMSISCSSECGCTGCNEKAVEYNEELMDRAKEKFNTIGSRANALRPFMEDCDRSLIDTKVDIEPHFYFHWGDGASDRIEEHDTEVFYLTVCNSFNDLVYKGLQIKKVTLIPNVHSLNKLQIVPDRLINLDCLEPCSCQTREFAMLTRANDIAGSYSLEVEYCYEEIAINHSGSKGVVSFPLQITQD